VTLQHVLTLHDVLTAKSKCRRAPSPTQPWDAISPSSSSAVTPTFASCSSSTHTTSTLPCCAATCNRVKQSFSRGGAARLRLHRVRAIVGRHWTNDKTIFGPPDTDLVVQICCRRHSASHESVCLASSAHLRCQVLPIGFFACFSEHSSANSDIYLYTEYLLI
jgi:hypothetical protein